MELSDRIKEKFKNLPEAKKKLFLERLKLNPFLKYIPHPKQREFHKSPARVRAFFGGNRSGKTRALIQEVIWYATGQHPYKPRWNQANNPKWKPADIWVVSLDFPSSRDVVQPMIQRVLGSGYWKQWNKTDRILDFHNGSTVSFKSVDSGWEKFQGTAKDLIAFDEEPEEKVWNECRMRVISTKGDIIVAMTPLHGMSFMYDKIYEPWILGSIPKEENECFVSSIKENPYIDVEEIKRIETGFFDEEKEARMEGRFVEFAGLVYKEFDPKVHLVKRFFIPKDWIKIRGIDPGLNNPTAVIWWAIGPGNEHFIYDEYYETDKTIKEFAEDIKAKTGLDQISYTVIDPASCSRNPAHPELRSVREEYSKYGIWTMAGNNDVSYGINAVKELLRTNPSSGRPKLFIFDDLQYTKREMMRYRWDTHLHHAESKNPKERPKNVMDHAVDAIRYIAASNPTYTAHSNLMAIVKQSFKPTRT
ncbi:MAG: terminase large subunit domain-containing protein [Candidatus Thorarchaeota archaeon]|jgi:phage terminase large subunit-like protein